ncbi:hypothetical protein NL495_27685, partial [Klebsiella pneumoniae]|nr:hypothetical protein [Klebsiella pneumoniae]
RGRLVASGRIDELGRALGAAGATSTRRVLVEVAGLDAGAVAERALRDVVTSDGGVREVFVEDVPGGAVLSCVVDGPPAIQGRMCLALVD